MISALQRINELRTKRRPERHVAPAKYSEGNQEPRTWNSRIANLFRIPNFELTFENRELSFENRSPTIIFQVWSEGFLQCSSRHPLLGGGCLLVRCLVGAARQTCLSHDSIFVSKKKAFLH